MQGTPQGEAAVDRAMQEWDTLANNPEMMKEILDSFKDPEVQAKAKEMINDPEYMRAAKKRLAAKRRRAAQRRGRNAVVLWHDACVPAVLTSAWSSRRSAVVLCHWRRWRRGAASTPSRVRRRGARPARSTQAAGLARAAAASPQTRRRGAGRRAPVR